MLNFDKNTKEAKRKRKLGKKYTSTITDRKFRTESFLKLNPKVDIETIEFIYTLGFYKRTDFWITVIEKCLKTKLFNLMNSIVFEVPETMDEMGYVPIGDYVKINLWKTKNNDFFTQLEHLPFHQSEHKSTTFVIKTLKLKSFNPKLIRRRELVYPIH